MQARIEGRDGWIEVVRDGVSVLAKGDPALAERIHAAIDAADGDDLADVVTDELTTGGVRRTPDFALVDQTSGRVLVRGTASVQVIAADGSTRQIVAPSRGPWADEDLEGEAAEIVVATGEPEPEVVDEVPESTPETAPPETSASPAPAPSGGWALPSVFSGPSATADPQPEAPRPSLTVVPDPAVTAADHAPAAESTEAGSMVASEEPTAQEPVEEATIIETPAPSGQDLVEDEPQPTMDDQPVVSPPADEAPSPAPSTGPSGDEEDLPSFDFLFGNTNHHRSSLISGLEDEEEADAASIDSGPVAAAGGFQAPENPTNATLAPPSDDEEHQAPPAHPEPTLSGGLPPMPGSTPAADHHAHGLTEQDQPSPDLTDRSADPEPSVETPAEEPHVSAPRTTPPPRPSFVQSARDDSTGHEPGRGRPQFVDGHLVGSRVPKAEDAGAAMTASGPPPSLPAEADQDSDGVISAVPWGGGGAPTGAGGPGLPGLPFGLPGLPTPDLGPAQPAQESAPTHAPEPAAASHPVGDTGEIPSGPMVLAVRCSIGHHNAPHATRCRVCGQDLPSQQPEQTPRPALGLLRLSTGDVVTLDRGVLIGRAPRASAEVSGARAPHLVRIASPDNEISRNHVEIVLDGWHVLVRDLGSTNGTTVALPGSSPVRVRPGDQQTIEPGTTITLADQVSMVFEVTG